MGFRCLSWYFPRGWNLNVCPGHSIGIKCFLRGFLKLGMGLLTVSASFGKGMTYMCGIKSEDRVASRAVESWGLNGSNRAAIDRKAGLA